MSPPKMISASLGAGVLVVIGVLLGARLTGSSTGMFTRDPAYLAGDLPFYAGSVSILTAVAWGAAAALALFVAAVGDPALRRSLQLFGLLALLLLADDVLMLHEAVGPWVGVPEHAFYALYAVVAAALAWMVRHDLRRGFGVALLLGAAFLGASLLSDVLLNDAFPDAYLVEDGLKVLGAFLWVTVPVLAWDVALPTTATGTEPPPAAASRSSPDTGARRAAVRTRTAARDRRTAVRR